MLTEQADGAGQGVTADKDAEYRKPTEDDLSGFLERDWPIVKPEQEYPAALSRRQDPCPQLVSNRVDRNRCPTIRGLTCGLDWVTRHGVDNDVSADLLR